MFDIVNVVSYRNSPRFFIFYNVIYYRNSPRFLIFLLWFSHLYHYYLGQGRAVRPVAIELPT